MPKIKPLFKSKAAITPNCEKCGLFKTCNTPRMKVTGAGKKKALIVAEAPGETEDTRGVQLVGEAGHELRRHLKSLGYDLDRDFWKINSVNCRPPKNRKPTRTEMSYCYPYVQSIIEEMKPKLIILLGGAAVESFYSGPDYGLKDLSITAWRGLAVPDRERNAWVCPTFHPSFLIRNEKDENLKAVFKEDLKNAFEMIEKPFPELKRLSDVVRIVKTLDEIVEELKEIQQHDILSLDYECDTIKPYDGKGKILTASLSCDDYAIAFPIHYPNILNKKEIKQLENILVKLFFKDKRIKKVCHNLKFEDSWTKCVLGTRIYGAIACTMIDTHILDPRGARFTSLKFQSFVRWGVKGYDREMKKYLPSQKSGYDKNRLHEMPIDKLLLYNGADTYLTQRLYRYQCEQFKQNKQLQKCRKHFFRSSKALCDVQLAGIHVDVDYYAKEKEKLKKQIQALHDKMLRSEEAEKYKFFTGRDLDINSQHCLRILFYRVLHFEAEKTTTTGMKSVDAETLHTWQGKSEFVDDLLMYRKLSKILGTYIGQFERETRNGKMHPSFDLNVAKTGRSASSSPNFQNIPKRDEVAKAAIRKGIKPSKGNKILEVDFGSLEVRIIACYSKCPVLVEYIIDESTDMHRDQAISLFKLDQFEKGKGDDKMIRFYSKNNWVFPQFYGSWYKSCSVGLIDNCFGLTTSTGLTVKKHLKKKGIKNEAAFVDHLKNEEEVFWKRFAAVKEWQKEQIANYKEVLHTDSFFGFQARGYLSNNDIINYPIQGAAFHCLLWCLIELNRTRIKRKWKSKIIGQIHDSIVFDLHPAEEKEILSEINNVMEVRLKEEHDWMIVPMKSEIEMTEINEAWYYKKEVKV